MTGTFGGALEARGIPASDDRLIGDVEGIVEKEDGVLRITEIHIRYRLRVDADVDREGIQRAYEAHPPNCPVYKTLNTAVSVTTELEVTDSAT